MTKNGIISLRALWFSFIVLTIFGVLVVTIYLSTDGTVGPLTWGSAQALLEKLGGGDAANYLRIGLDLQDGRLSSENLWILNLWPPGMTFLYTGLLYLPGSLIPKMVVVSVVFWAFAGALVASILAARMRRLVVFLFLFYWAFGTAAFSWLLGTGLLYSDGIGSALLIIFIALAFLAGENRPDSSLSSRRRVFFALLAGFSLAVSLYFRWAYLVVVVFIVVFAVLGILWFAVRSFVSRRTVVSDSKRDVKRPEAIQVLAGLAIGVIVVVAPWTAYVAVVLHPGNPAWSTGDYQWAQRWLTDAQLINGGASFLAEGGANWACKVAPERCLELNPIAVANDSEDYPTLRDEALAAAVTNPIEFVANRLTFGTRAAFSLPGSPVGSFSGIEYGVLGAAMFLAMASLLVRFFRRNVLFSCTLLLSGMGLLAALAVAHFETRYLIPITLVVGVSTFLLSSNLRFLGQDRRVIDDTLATPN
jgi:hypothetical protein